METFPYHRFGCAWGFMLGKLDGPFRGNAVLTELEILMLHTLIDEELNIAFQRLHLS